MRTLLGIVVVSVFSAQAQQPALKAFDSPDAAAKAAITAAEKNDLAELTAIFGARSKAILSSGDPAQDKQERAEFARMANASHKIEKDPMNLHRVILDIGPEDWPFPVPIVENGGKWSFDPDQGELEVHARRIGANEIDTVEALAGLVEAQHHYAEADHDGDGILEFAKTIAEFDKTAIAEAELRPGKIKATPFHGYYFRILESQGPNAAGGAHQYVVDGKHMMAGFAIVAWPSDYGVTGIHTFIVNQNGNVYEKDLGKMAPVRTFDPDRTWRAVDEADNN